MEVETLSFLLRIISSSVSIAVVVFIYLFFTKEKRSFYYSFMICFSFSLLISVFTINLQASIPKIIFALFYFFIIVLVFFTYLRFYNSKLIKDIALVCIVCILNIILFFAYIYSIIERNYTNSFSNIRLEPIDRAVDFIFFSVMTFTVGFGDIIPQTSLAKLLVVSEILIAFTMIVLVVIFAREKKIVVKTKRKTLPKRRDWLRYRR